jgi:glycosyltransferase involved in cell wall biosynthesis
LIKILLEGSRLSSDFAGGVVNYLNNLIRYYQIHDTNLGIQSHVLLINKMPDGTYKKDSHREIFKNSMVKTSLQFAKMMLFGVSKEYVIFHSPYMFLPPKRKNRINILTILDMINFERPLSTRNILRESMLRLAIKRADFYVCISEATKTKLQFHFSQIKDNKILVTHLGIEESFLTEPKSEKFKELARKKYLLYVGQRSGYKNFTALVKFIALSRRGAGIKVLCVGGGKFSKDEMVLLRKYNLVDTITHVGYSTLEDLKFLYQNAIALAYTSLAEGFGLPILEAMASRCPVICGNFSSMKEIAGGHAILVDDFSVSSMEEAIEKAISIDEDAIDEAKSYASKFTWENTAVETLSLYKRLASSLEKIK